MSLSRGNTQFLGNTSSDIQKKPTVSESETAAFTRGGSHFEIANVQLLQPSITMKRNQVASKHKQAACKLHNKMNRQSLQPISETHWGRH